MTGPAALVNDHDFRSDAHGLAVPYGLYDVLANRGTLYVGTSHDTPEFAADNLARWWREEGELRYPDATELLVLADGGGSNGYRNRAFKHGIQNRLCDPHSLVVTIAHYPSGASKWNPIDHRLFSEVSKNWAGRPPGQLPNAHRVRFKHAHHGGTRSDRTTRRSVLSQGHSRLRGTDAHADIEFMPSSRSAITPSTLASDAIRIGKLFLSQP